MVLETLRRLLRARGHAWLLAWALCLPLAQWACATHALLHLHAVASEDRDAPAQMPAFCDTCVVAAVIGGAAPLPVAGLPVAAPIAQAAPELRTAAPPRTSPFLAFRTRAPPSLPA
jgi:hypothetical protein